MRLSTKQLRERLRALKRKYWSSGCIDFPGGKVRRSGEPNSPEVCAKVEVYRDQLRAHIQEANQGWCLRSMRLILHPKPIVRREEAGFATSLLFCDVDERLRGIYLVPSGVEHPEERQRFDRGIREKPWFSFVPEDVPSGEQNHRVGWPAEKARITWSYVRDAASVWLELAWSLGGLPSDWQARIAAALPKGAPWRVDGVDTVVLQAERPGAELIFRGRFRLSPEDPLPLRRVFRGRDPVILQPVSSEAEEGGQATETNSEEAREIQATIPVVKMTALVQGRETRFVSRGDLAEPFHLVIVTEPRLVLPLSIQRPEGWPWDFKVEDLGLDRGNPALHTWRLTAEPGARGTWEEVPWEEQALVWPFSGGSPQRPAATLWRVETRKVRFGWSLADAGSHDTALCFVRPVWRAVGLPLPDSSIGNGDAYAYHRHVSVTIEGVEEQFPVDPESELPEQRLVVVPERLRIFAPSGERVAQPEILGPAGGRVWWRPWPRALPGEERQVRPAAWAMGETPLLATDGKAAARGWGGLVVATELPPDAIELPVVLSADRDRAAILVAEDAATLWINHWGFVDRYARRQLHFPGAGAIVAWAADKGLPLFPEPPSPLLRSMSPMYAVVDEEEPLICRLELSEGSARPVLFLGGGLKNGKDVVSIQVGSRTRLRAALGSALPPEEWGAQALAGSSLRLDRKRTSDEALWIAVEPTGENEDLPRLLLRCDGDGWRLSGFYLPPGGMVRLGSDVLPDTGRSVAFVLEDPAASNHRRLTLEIHLENDIPTFHWTSTPPEAIARTPQEELRNWYVMDALEEEKAPEPLRVYRKGQVSVGTPTRVEFFLAGDLDLTQQTLAIRAWRAPVEPPRAEVTSPTTGNAQLLHEIETVGRKEQIQS